MTFQPFGYRFEITSELTPTEAKAAIRSKKTTVFDVKNGARGWIVGPFICLWFSALLLGAATLAATRYIKTR